VSRRVLVTGGYGFVGSAFVSKAQTKHEVIRIARTARAGDDIVWDLTGATHPPLPESDYLVHVASLTARQSDDATSAAEYRRHNVTGTQNLFGALASLPRYVLYVSTTDVYGHDKGELITEQTTLQPQTLYARSKLEAEQVTASFCAARGIRLGIARLGPIYGPGEAAYKKAIPTFISLAVAGKTLTILGEGRAKRQYLYVDDVARALALMLDVEFDGVLNLAGATAVSIADLAQLIVELSGNATGIEQVVSERPEADVLFDTAKLSGLGFAETVPLSEGLGREIAWYRGRRDAADAHSV